MAISFISGGNQSTPKNQRTCHKSLTDLSDNVVFEYTSPGAEFKLITLVVIDTDCIGSYESNYHTITAMMASIKSVKVTKRSCQKNTYISYMYKTTFI
jgi:hypothetical protein